MPDGSINVLLVEDHPGDARLIQELLREAGTIRFDLAHADRLEAGIERLAEGGIDLVLLDFSLPDSRGMDTFHAAAAVAPRVPIIVLTHLDDEELAIRTVQEGAQDYLVKGNIDSGLLIRAIRYAIERKKTEERLEQYTQELHDRNAQLQNDLNMAREIQQALMPQQYPCFPHDAPSEESALHFCHAYHPSSTVSGDFFDVRALSDTAAAVLICDVMGHGLRAALVGSILRGIIQEIGGISQAPGAFLTKLNRGLKGIFARTYQTVFATAVHLVVDTATGRARYADAGHPRPLHLRPNAGSAELLQLAEGQRGPALGLMDEYAYVTCESQLEPRDTLMLYTDGLTEANRPDGERYGKDRFLEVVRRNLALPPERVCDELLQDVRQFTGTDHFNDDLCLVGVQRVR